MNAVTAILRVLAFLARMPPVARAFAGDHRLGDDVWAFPLAGLLAALPSALALWALPHLGLSPLVAAVAGVGTMVAITGALHEDGLGDVADGLGGHHERERVLAIMKDSRVGSYGALALVFTALARVALLAELLAVAPGLTALAYLGVAAASRGAMAWLWADLPSARAGGLADSVGRPGRSAGLAALGLGVVLQILCGLPLAGGGLAVPPLVAAFVFLWFRSFIRRRIGGQTGDCLGAVQQLVEIGLLFGLALLA